MNEREFHDRHYEQEAAAFEQSALFARIHARSVRQFLARTASGPRHRVLSLGCGDGRIERRLAPHVGEVIGVDISPVAVRQAREKAQAAGLRNVTFLVAGEAAPESWGPFDRIAAFAFLHHLSDGEIRRTLARTRRLLRPGGVFYSADPSRRRLVRLFARLVREAYDRHHSPDERELDPRALERFAVEVGLKPRLFYSDYFIGPLAWLAPRMPTALCGPLEALDELALRLPFVRRFASSFSMVAAAPGPA
jgi:SAM-dependent methyltransferase